MENSRTAGASIASVEAAARGVDPEHDFDVEQDFDLEFATFVAGLNDNDPGEYDTGEYHAGRDFDSDAQEYIDALLEARAVMASMQAREQRLLARLHEVALGEAGPNASGTTRELAWRSMAAEIAIATKLADRTIQSMMGRADELVTRLPATLAALETGAISLGHARVILEHSKNIEDAALKEYERVAVPRAQATTPGKLASTAKIVAARLRSATFEERHAAAREERCVTIRDLDEGMSELIHVVPTVYAAAIFDRLTRQAKAVSAAGDPRSRDQLRADLATDLLLTGEPACGADAPHTAAEGIRAEVAILIPALTLLGHGDEPATLRGRGPIDLDTACRLASKAPELIRLLTDPVNDIAVSADTYRPSASLRRFLELRDRHCQFPMCNRDARHCDIDHTVAYAHGGKTTPDNLAVLCRGHHTIKHRDRWRVKQVTPGVLEWTTPLGRTVASTSVSSTAPPGPRFTVTDDACGGEPPPF